MEFFFRSPDLCIINYYKSVRWNYLKNKILITGATAGIGEALLNKFLSLNNHVIALGRNEEKLKELARKR